MKKIWVWVATLGITSAAIAADEMVRGYSLTETWTYNAQGAKAIDLYDAQMDPNLPKTDAQKRVDALFALGVRRINLSPQANMRDPRSYKLEPNINTLGGRRQEKERLKRLISYVHSKGMTVGIRPIFFVLSPKGEPGWDEVIDGVSYRWWHGNICPDNVNAWFERYRAFLASYYELADEKNGVEEFTIGAELFSMTVGIEDHPRCEGATGKQVKFGWPDEWVKTLGEARKLLPKSVKIMYDINFTDMRSDNGDLSRFGGEFARWYYRLTFDKPDPKLMEFWKSLDRVGIDLYRSLATDEEAKKLPANYDDLVKLLKNWGDLYAEQIDQSLTTIRKKIGAPKEIILKEIGFASRELGFVRPFEYAGAKGKLSIDHQAAAYEAIFQSFWKSGADWLKGIVWWDASVNEKLHGPEDLGFSPLGKPRTEAVLKAYWP